MPGLVPDPRAKLAVMRKGGTIALSDYGVGGPAPPALTFGLAWDITNGKDIDLDASVICLDANLRAVDLVFFQARCYVRVRPFTHHVSALLFIYQCLNH